MRLALFLLALTFPPITVHHSPEGSAVRTLVREACQLLPAAAVPTYPVVVDAPGHQFDLVPPEQRAQLRAQFRAMYGTAEADYPAGALIGVRDPVIFLSLASDGIRLHDPAKVAALLVYANDRAHQRDRRASWRDAATVYQQLLNDGHATDRAFLDRLIARAGA